MGSSALVGWGVPEDSTQYVRRSGSESPLPGVWDMSALPETSRVNVLQSHDVVSGFYRYSTQYHYKMFPLGMAFSCCRSWTCRRVLNQHSIITAMNWRYMGVGDHSSPSHPSASGPFHFWSFHWSFHLWSFHSRTCKHDYNIYYR